MQKQIQNTSENEPVTRPEAAQLLRARPRTVNCQMPIHLSKSTIAKRRCETQSGQGGGNRAGVLRKIGRAGPSEDLPRPVDAKTSTTITIRRALCQVNADAREGGRTGRIEVIRHEVFPIITRTEEFPGDFGSPDSCIPHFCLVFRKSLRSADCGTQRRQHLRRRLLRFSLVSNPSLIHLRSGRRRR